MAATLNIQPSMDDHDYDSMEGIIYYGRGEGAERADSGTLGSTQSRFLSLPRELRDVIYGYTTVDMLFRGKQPDNGLKWTSITALMPETPDVTVFGVAKSGLLYVNRQIHDEYIDHVQPRSGHQTKFHTAQTPFLQALDISAIVPRMNLSKIKSVDMVVSSWCFLDADDSDRMYDWLLSGETHRRDLEWTPAKELRSKLVTLLDRLHALMSPDARVQLRIDLSDFPEPLDPYTWCWFEEHGTYKFWHHLVAAFHQDTIVSLEHDTALAWPLPGNFTVCGQMRLPLWCAMASNSAEIMETRKAWAAGEGSLRPPTYEEGVVEKSDEEIMVKLRPTVDGSSWCWSNPEITSYHRPCRVDLAGDTVVTLERYQTMHG
ncbi:hypothetical protein LTR10_001020 [Elasticomyces elasticus]|nr:hypothetical protein LTR10_001020 [Elasticomyces elasticus]KAK4979732.1 hypothetical protein LTR42_000038 [Elasticomyces elasticus]